MERPVFLRRRVLHVLERSRTHRLDRIHPCRSCHTNLHLPDDTTRTPQGGSKKIALLQNSSSLLPKTSGARRRVALRMNDLCIDVFYVKKSCTLPNIKSHYYYALINFPLRRFINVYIKTYPRSQFNQSAGVTCPTDYCKINMPINPLKPHQTSHSPKSKFSQTQTSAHQTIDFPSIKIKKRISTNKCTLKITLKTVVY